MFERSDVLVGVIVVAAGVGQRLGCGVPKAQVCFGGASILEHALRGILDSGVAEEICVVVPAGDTALRAIVDSVAAGVPVTAVDGGVSRAESVRAGLAVLSHRPNVVLVHDAARALTPPAVFHRVVEGLRAGMDAVIPGVNVTDTIKSVADGRVTGTLDRTTLRAVQTPQGFSRALLTRAHDSLSGPQPTDDAMLLESLGIPVQMVEGASEAFKITTPQDLLLAESMSSGKQSK